jgi:transcriptional regulator with XRE-family HTH domain
MDKRYTALTLAQQMDLRRKAVDDVLAHQEWSLPEAIRHLKKTMRLTTAELAKLAGVGFRTLQDIEQERSEGSVQTMGRIFAVLGLKLGVVRATPNAPATPTNTRTDGHTPDQA